MNLLRRHPVAIALVFLLLVTAVHPLSPLVDAITGSTPGDVDLDRPVLYVLSAPISNVIDALTFFILGLRWFPPGRKAPSRTSPDAEMTRRNAEDHFLAGIAGWLHVERDLLPTRSHDLFVKHPRLGDLTIPEWIRFHWIHGRHHARQIRARLGT